jgi:hypothetical protein
MLCFKSRRALEIATVRWINATETVVFSVRETSKEDTGCSIGLGKVWHAIVAHGAKPSLQPVCSSEHKKKQFLGYQCLLRVVEREK